MPSVHRMLALLIAVVMTFIAGCGNDDDPSVEAAAGPEDHNSADVSFAQDMIPHHVQAVVMSDLAPTRAQRPEVKDLARRIKSAQQPEIDQMAGWLSGWGEEIDAGEHGGHGDAHGGGDSMGMLSDDELGRLEQAGGAEFDRLFLEGMIGHHEGAVDMAEAELAEGTFAEAKELARTIAATQRAEIDEMNLLLAG